MYYKLYFNINIISVVTDCFSFGVSMLIASIREKRINKPAKAVIVCVS